MPASLIISANNWITKGSYICEGHGRNNNFALHRWLGVFYNYCRDGLWFKQEFKREDVTLDFCQLFFG